MTPLVFIHLIAAICALAVGAAILFRQKGTLAHKLLGRGWVGMMIIVAGSSFWVTELNGPGKYSWIHGLSLWTLFALFMAVRHVRRGNINAHKYWMLGTFSGLVIAGAFTLAPGRIVGKFIADLF